MRISRSILLSLSIVCACTITGLSQSINWSSDSNTGFTLQISGYSSAFYETMYSPSGLWEVSTGFGTPVPNVFTQSALSITYLPTGGYWNRGGYAAPIIIDEPLLSDGAVVDTLPAGWSAVGTTELFTPPDDQGVFDGSWAIDVSASGPALPVPEPNPLLLVGIGILGLSFGHRVGLRCRRKGMPNSP